METGEDISEITYFTCLKILSEAIGKIPIYLLNREKKRITEHESYKILQISANEYQTPTQLMTMLEYNRNHRGNGFAYCEREENGELKSIIPLNPLNVQIWINNTEEFTDLKYFYMYSDSRSGKSYWLNPSDVLHVKSWITEENGISGRSVREILARTLSGAKESNKFLNELYSKGLLANICIKYIGDISKESQRKILERIEAQARENNRKMILLPNGFDIIPLDLKLTDNQFLEIKQFTALQISAAFGISPTFINDYSKSSYSNSTAENLSFYVNTLLPIITNYEQELNRKLLTEEELKSGLHFKFNIGVLLRNNPSEQAQIIQTFVQNGIYSINEARNLLDREPCENGEKRIMNGSYVSLEDLGIAYKGRGESGAENQE